MATLQEQREEEQGLLAQAGRQAAADRARAESASLQSRQASQGPSEEGLITGPFIRKRREKAEAAAGAAQSEAVAALGQGQARNIVQAAGVDMSKIPPDVAAGITTLLADPETRALGVAELQELQEIRRAAQPTDAQVRGEAITRGLAMQSQRNKVQAPLFGQMAACQQMISSLNEATGFGDIGGIFGLFKFLDPGSRVTGSEVELSSTASTFAQQAQVLLQRISGEGGLMTPDQRGQLSSLVNGQIGLLQSQMIKNNSFFNEQLGAVMEGQFSRGLEQALAVSRSPFFQPDIDIGEFVPKANPDDGGFIQENQLLGPEGQLLVPVD